MNKLPNVFANPINKEINNVQEMFYGKENRNIKHNGLSINTKINNIFRSKEHVYKSKVRITFIGGVEEEVIVGKTNLNLLTMEGKLIRITDILDIERI
ncbi:MAG: hypothetical protein RSF02_00910 [Bacilli bacterium]